MALEGTLKATHEGSGFFRRVYETIKRALVPHQVLTRGLHCSVVQALRTRWLIHDYGGQEYQHVNHPMFLSKRNSIYVIVIPLWMSDLEGDSGGREYEDEEALVERYVYWLKFVNSFSPRESSSGSVCITLINKFTRRFKSLKDKGQIYVDAKAKRIADRLKELQKKWMYPKSNLKFFGDPLPIDAQKLTRVQRYLAPLLTDALEVLSVEAQPENEFLANLVLKFQRLDRKALRYSDFSDVVLEEHRLLSPPFRDAVCKHVLKKLAAKNELVFVPGKGSGSGSGGGDDDQSIESSWIVVDINWLTQTIVGNIMYNLDKHRKQSGVSKYQLTKDDLNRYARVDDEESIVDVFNDNTILPEILHTLGICYKHSDDVFFPSFCTIDKRSDDWNLVPRDFLSQSNPSYLRTIKRLFVLKDKATTTLTSAYFSRLVVDLMKDINPPAGDMRVFSDGSVIIKYSRTIGVVPVEFFLIIDVLNSQSSYALVFYATPNASSPSSSSSSPSSSSSSSSWTEDQSTRAWMEFTSIRDSIFDAARRFNNIDLVEVCVDPEPSRNVTHEDPRLELFLGDLIASGRVHDNDREVVGFNEKAIPISPLLLNPEASEGDIELLRPMLFGRLGTIPADDSACMQRFLRDCCRLAGSHDVTNASFLAANDFAASAVSRYALCLLCHYRITRPEQLSGLCRDDLVAVLVHVGLSEPDREKVLSNTHPTGLQYIANVWHRLIESFWQSSTTGHEITSQISDELQSMREAIQRIDPRVLLNPHEIESLRIVEGDSNLLQYFNCLQSYWNEAFITAKVMSSSEFMQKGTMTAAGLNAGASLLSAFPILPALLSAASTAVNVRAQAHSRAELANISLLIPSGDPTNFGVFSRAVALGFAMAYRDKLGVWRQDRSRISQIQNFFIGHMRQFTATLDEKTARGLFGASIVPPIQAVAMEHAYISLRFVKDRDEREIKELVALVDSSTSRPTGALMQRLLEEVQRKHSYSRSPRSLSDDIAFASKIRPQSSSSDQCQPIVQPAAADTHVAFTASDNKNATGEGHCLVS